MCSSALIPIIQSKYPIFKHTAKRPSTLLVGIAVDIAVGIAVDIAVGIAVGIADAKVLISIIVKTLRMPFFFRPEDFNISWAYMRRNI